MSKKSDRVANEIIEYFGDRCMDLNRYDYKKVIDEVISHLESGLDCWNDEEET